MAIGDAPLTGRRPPEEPERPTLHRSIGPVQLALYGLGSMLGSGIYGLIGQAAGQVGNVVWLAFVVALVAALLTALSYASLGSRYPRAAGAAYVTERAYGLPPLDFVVGLALVCSGAHLSRHAVARLPLQSRGASEPAERSPLVARARLSVRARRSRVPRHSRIHLAECALHAGRGLWSCPCRGCRPLLLGAASIIWKCRRLLANKANGSFCCRARCSPSSPSSALRTHSTSPRSAAIRDAPFRSASSSP
jgi:hypothetical protein